MKDCFVERTRLRDAHIRLYSHHVYIYIYMRNMHRDMRSPGDSVWLNRRLKTQAPLFVCVVQVFTLTCIIAYMPLLILFDLLCFSWPRFAFSACFPSSHHRIADICIYIYICIQCVYIFMYSHRERQVEIEVYLYNMYIQYMHIHICI